MPSARLGFHPAGGGAQTPPGPQVLPRREETKVPVVEWGLGAVQPDSLALTVEKLRPGREERRDGHGSRAGAPAFPPRGAEPTARVRWPFMGRC